MLTYLKHEINVSKRKCLLIAVGGPNHNYLDNVLVHQRRILLSIQFGKKGKVYYAFNINNENPLANISIQC